MSTKEAMTEAYADYQYAEEAREKILSRICLKTSLVAAPLITLFCVAISMRSSDLFVLWLIVAVLLFATTAGVIMHGVKLYQEVPKTPVRLWAEAAENHLRACGVERVSPPMDEYVQPLAPSGLGVQYVDDPALLYSGIASVPGHGQARVDIRVVGWHVLALVNGRELMPRKSFLDGFEDKYTLKGKNGILERSEYKGTQVEV